MKPEITNVISIGYGRHLFIDGNPEQLRLRECGREVGKLHLIVFTHKHEAYHQREVTPALALYPTQSRNRFFMLFDAFMIARHIIKQSAHRPIVTTQDAFETGFIGLILKVLYGTKLVVQEHGDVFGTKHWRSESLGNRIRYYLGYFIVRRADVVRVVSRRIEHIMKRLGISKVTTLPVSIDTTPFIEARTNNSALRHFPAETFVFLSVARLVPQKNLALMLRAFAKAHAENPLLRLLLVGSGPLEPKIRHLIAELFGEGSDVPVKLLPWSDNVPALMAGADAYLLSSNYEGWARVLIEAMVAQVPVVTTDVGCVGEVLIDQKHGLVVPVGDEAALASAIHVLSSDKVLYQRIKDELGMIDPARIPGTDMSTYGRRWADSLIN